MRTGSPIQLYRFAKAATQVGEFTVAEMRSVARIPKGTIEYALSNLQDEIPGLFEKVEVREQRVGRPPIRYVLTETGAKSLARKVAELGQKIAENEPGEVTLAESLPVRAAEPASAKVAGWIGSLESVFQEALKRYATLVFRAAEPVATLSRGVVAPVEPALSYSYEQILEILRAILTEWQWERLEKRGWTAGSYRLGSTLSAVDIPDVDICVERSESVYAVEVRPLVGQIPSFGELHLAARTRALSNLKSGMVLVCGNPGSGRSQTMASLVNTINESAPERITTIEEPARYFYPRAKALLDQKQVAIDTPGFGEGLELALRNGARVVALGEWADLRTFSIALEAAETRLLFCRVAAATPYEAIRNIVAPYSAAEQPEIRTRLAKNLQGIIYVRALPRKGSQSGEVMASASVECDERFRSAMVDADWDRALTSALTGNKALLESYRESVCSLHESGLVDEMTVGRTLGSIEKCEW